MSPEGNFGAEHRPHPFSVFSQPRRPDRTLEQHVAECDRIDSDAIPTERTGDPPDICVKSRLRGRIGDRRPLHDSGTTDGRDAHDRACGPCQRRSGRRPHVRRRPEVQGEDPLPLLIGLLARRHRPPSTHVAHHQVQATKEATGPGDGLLGPNGRRDVAGCRYRTVNLGYDLGNPARRAAVDGNPITDSRQVLGDPTTDSSCRTGHQRPPMDLIVKNHGG